MLSYIILCGSIVGSVNVVYEENLGVVDFHPSKDVGIVYVSEADLVSGQTYKRKLVKLRKVSSVKVYIIFFTFFNIHENHCNFHKEDDIVGGGSFCCRQGHPKQMTGEYNSTLILEKVLADLKCHMSYSIIYTEISFSIQKIFFTFLKYVLKSL